MSSDRPEDVPERLDELEATVRGLTQELVEANERIRQLEAQVEEAEEPQSNKPIPAENNGTVSDDPRDDGTDDDGELGDDIIVA